MKRQKQGTRDMKEWTLPALYRAMQKDLELCNTECERINCMAICKKEIRNLANETQKTRRLTPGEISILLNV